ncbi:hypothetical protein IMZ31_23390 (plasmid) [Pontibacillus sp. ALD_SL1]|uniref:hypothetical protein n=1 Tax=Pontibacillus sp. ALD_SL1 TaxID=2777185 RepID=UPI001A978502|nr:hypothetical protein [Pontibacillus sp. ALD_SL1]QST02397.1 hypothetical protein IMZ31_23390 [Pontibacillus sp. ALD_SL1]
MKRLPILFFLLLLAACSANGETKTAAPDPYPSLHNEAFTTTCLEIGSIMKEFHNFYLEATADETIITSGEATDHFNMLFDQLNELTEVYFEEVNHIVKDDLYRAFGDSFDPFLDSVTVMQRGAYTADVNRFKEAEEGLTLSLERLAGWKSLLQEAKDEE